MLGHGGSSASSYLADPTSPIPSHCCNYPVSKCPSASIVATSTLRVNDSLLHIHIFSGDLLCIIYSVVVVKHLSDAAGRRVVKILICSTECGISGK